MRQHCDDAEGQLKLTVEASRSLLEQAESLRYERYALDFWVSYPHEHRLQGKRWKRESPLYYYFSIVSRSTKTKLKLSLLARFPLVPGSFWL